MMQKEFYDELQRERDVLLDYADDSVDVKKFLTATRRTSLTRRFTR